jgi:tetratricopeptide (TPR) repeat protein
VNQQSEHLSSAQIEEYGIRTSGAGPDGEEEVAVEKHLDDCPSCRGRILEFQRKQLGLSTKAARSSQNNPKSAGREAGDQNLKNPEFVGPPEGLDREGASLRVTSKANTTATTGCPSEEDLRNLAAGIVPDASAGMVQHAAACDHCGPLLQAYTEDFSDDFSPEQRSGLQQLGSASPEWRRQTAMQMLRTASATRDSGNNPNAADHAKESGIAKIALLLPRGFLFSRWALIPASATACALVAFAIFYFLRDTPEEAEKLLARAYTEQRTMEVRWPGAAHGTYSALRGSTTAPPPIPLMKAENMLEGHSAENPQDSGWNRAIAEKEIALGNPARAIAILEAARSGSASMPLLLDLAIAYFIQGEQGRDQASFEKSRQMLNSVLEQQPRNAVALFNRALVHERLQDFEKAKEDWNTFIKTETDTAWLEEAQKRLRELKEIHGNMGR